MSQSSRHTTSRALLAVLALTVLVGLLVYLQRSAAKAVVQPAVAPTSRIETTADAIAQAAPANGPAQVTVTGGDPVRTETPASGSVKEKAAAKDKTATKEKPAASPTDRPAPKSEPKKDGPPPLTATLPPGEVSHAMADAKTKFEAGDLLGARDLLNAALPSLNGVDKDAARTMLSDINKTVVYSPKRFATDPFGGTYAVQSGDALVKIARRYSITAELLMRINNISDERKLRAGSTIKVIQGPFFAVVNKKEFRLDLYLGGLPGENPAIAATSDSATPTGRSMYVCSYPVGLGKEDSTPTGKWELRQGEKLKNPKFWGAGDLPPMEPDDPKNPLGEYWIALEGLDGNAAGQQHYGIHGTIDPDSIGKQASMGCIRLKNGDIERVFEALVDGKSLVRVE